MLAKTMPRNLIAILIAIYAIAFAFGAMAAIRWPSLMMFAGMMFETDPLSGLDRINWRELGIVYGAPYFLAGLCLYASAMMVSKKRPGAMTWYVFGCTAGFPCVFLADFDAGWWRDPSAAEGAVTGAALTAILLGIAVWNLRVKRADTAAGDVAAPSQPQPISPTPIITPPETKPARQKPRYRKPVPAAIARQRAQFAADGRRMLAKRRR